MLSFVCVIYCYQLMVSVNVIRYCYLVLLSVNVIRYCYQLFCRMNGNIVIVGDFNIDWFNTNGSERRLPCIILEAFHLFKMYAMKHTDTIIYLTIITRKDSNIISNFIVSDLSCYCCCLPRSGPSSSQSRFPLSR